MFHRLLAGIATCMLSVAATAGTRDYCPDRPGLGTPSCTIDRGHVSVEVGLADWSLDRSAAERDDTLLIGDLLDRYWSRSGVTSSILTVRGSRSR
jgi:hypothetical protein